VVVLDLDLPMRQAFHALHEQVGQCGGGTRLCCTSSQLCAVCNSMHAHTHIHSRTQSSPMHQDGHTRAQACQINAHQHTHTPRVQGIASAPVWDTYASSITGVISASDFINILTRLRHSVTAGANPMSEAEMDAHTIRWVWASRMQGSRALQPCTQGIAALGHAQVAHRQGWAHAAIVLVHSFHACTHKRTHMHILKHTTFTL